MDILMFMTKLFLLEFKQKYFELRSGTNSQDFVYCGAKNITILKTFMWISIHSY